MKKHNNNKPGPASYFVVFAIVTILGLFGWVSERDYKHQQEVAQLRQALLVAASESECATVEFDLPFDPEYIQL